MRERAAEASEVVDRGCDSYVGHAVDWRCHRALCGHPALRAELDASDADRHPESAHPVLSDQVAFPDPAASTFEAMTDGWGRSQHRLQLEKSSLVVLNRSHRGRGTAGLEGLLNLKARLEAVRAEWRPAATRPSCLHQLFRGPSRRAVAL
ncbi:hypothetical protein Ahu01nite_073020 [Winogradskya humida]|uniref:Uncharacterized protein n=1 Tax=Winogradskya humida TaxID=113566 RepID=A0ABQ4A006_9ACTN|nr:hypothetical protein Ahu01nite_073020 [Actinoplanes humidus]